MKKSSQDEVALKTRSLHAPCSSRRISAPHGAVVGRRPCLLLLASSCGCVGLQNCIVGFQRSTHVGVRGSSCTATSLAHFVWISLSSFCEDPRALFGPYVFRLVCPPVQAPLDDWSGIKNWLSRRFTCSQTVMIPTERPGCAVV